MGDVLKNSVKVVDFYEINFFAISEIAIFFSLQNETYYPKT